MRPRRSVIEWRRVVFAHPTINAKVKVYLLYLADRMDDNRTVKVRRSDVAAALGTSERRIDDWNTAARNAGLLDVVRRGQKHVVAEYQGLFPEPLSATKSSALSEPESPSVPGQITARNRRAENGQITARNRRAENGLSATPGGRTYISQPPARPTAARPPNAPACTRCGEALPCRCSSSSRKVSSA